MLSGGGLVLSMMSVAWAANAQPGTLCLQNERTIFSCPLKNTAKLVSLCGSRDLAEGSGYLQYRFGRRGKVELEFPNERRGSPKAFRHTLYTRYQVNRFSVSFSVGNYTYTVFDNHDGEMEPPTHEVGVAIERSGDRRRELLCRGSGSGNLRELQSIVPCDKDDALNMGGCG